MNPAETLNQELTNSSIVEMLSEKGRDLFFPSKGIISQSAEAKKKAHFCNATIGIATQNEKPYSFSVFDPYFNDLGENEIYNYTPSYGNKELRDLWQQRIIKNTPSLNSNSISSPIVTSGLTHSLSVVSELFFEEGDTLILPNQFWGNYKLLFNVRGKINIKNFDFFNEEMSCFNSESFEKILMQQSSDIIKILLNFPNNPTGYSPTKKDVAEIIRVIQKVIDSGKKVLVVLDDAYYGLFFEEDTYKESLFGELSQLHENCLAVKVCGATKEYCVWGFRVGFITYGIKNNTPEIYSALEQKTGGCIRGMISNCSTLSQNLMVKVLNDPQSEKDSATFYNLLKKRYSVVKKVLDENKQYLDCFQPYPFNSGYFMLVKLNQKLDNETIRTELLEQNGIGVISTGDNDIRIAFSSAEEEKIPIIFEKLFEVCKNKL